MEKQKTILITGSSRGIGKAIAELAHKEGCKVIVHGKSDSKELDEMSKKLEGSLKVIFDVSDREEANKKIEEILAEVGTIDVLVNNAGVLFNRTENVEDYDTQKAIDEYKVNVLGVLNCTEAIIHSMIKKGSGSIINISSFKGLPNYSTMSSITYGATKAGVVSLTKALAKRYAKNGVRFNVVYPGYTEGTGISETWEEDTLKRVNEGILLGRPAKTSEIAEAVMFLASDKSSYMTGSEILVDGGYTIKGK